MPKPRGRQHTTLTETAALVVRELTKVKTDLALKMIAPGEIRTTRRGRAGRRHMTVVTTPAGCELIITGQSVQRVSVHTNQVDQLTQYLQQNKSLRDFRVTKRLRLPDQ